MSKKQCFRIKVLSDFSAAHALRGYVGKCARIHGHNWKIETEINCQKLDDIGISIDFSNVKSMMKEITSPYDHQFLNEIPPFDKINPTAENIAKFLFEKLSELINSQECKLEAITIWENDRSSIRYYEDD